VCCAGFLGAELFSCYFLHPFFRGTFFGSGALEPFRHPCESPFSFMNLKFSLGFQGPFFPRCVPLGFLLSPPATLQISYKGRGRLAIVSPLKPCCNLLQRISIFCSALFGWSEGGQLDFPLLFVSSPLSLGRMGYLPFHVLFIPFSQESMILFSFIPLRKVNVGGGNIHSVFLFFFPPPT